MCRHITEVEIPLDIDPKDNPYEDEHSRTICPKCGYIMKNAKNFAEVVKRLTGKEIDFDY